MVADKLHPGNFLFDRSNFMSALFPLLDVFAVTVLFLSRRTAAYGYLLNGLIVIFGTIFMAHFSLAEVITKSLPYDALIFKSTLPDILLAWGDFLIGKALYDFHMTGGK